MYLKDNTAMFLEEIKILEKLNYMIKKKDLLVLIASYESKVTAKSLENAKAYKEVCKDLLNLVKNCSIPVVVPRLLMEEQLHLKTGSRTLNVRGVYFKNS